MTQYPETVLRVGAEPRLPGAAPAALIYSLGCAGLLAGWHHPSPTAALGMPTLTA